MQEICLVEQEQPVGVLTSPVSVPAMTLCSYGTKLTREELVSPGGNAGGHSDPQTHSAYCSRG